MAFQFRSHVELSNLFAKERHGNDDAQGCNSAEKNAWDQSQPVGCQSAFEFPEFVGSSDENGVDSGDSPSHPVRRVEPENGLAYHDTDPIENTAKKQGDDR